MATIFFDQKMTYGELRDNVRRLATALKGMGVQKGDRVALMLPNCPQMIISYYGVLEAGAVVTNISPLHVEREVEYELNDSGSETIIYLDLFHSRVEAVKGTRRLKRSIVTSITDYMETPVAPAAEKGPDIHYFREVVDGLDPGRAGRRDRPGWRTWRRSSTRAGPRACPRASCLPTATCSPTRSR